MEPKIKTSAIKKARKYEKKINDKTDISMMLDSNINYFSIHFFSILQRTFP